MVRLPDFSGGLPEAWKNIVLPGKTGEKSFDPFPR